MSEITQDFADNPPKRAYVEIPHSILARIMQLPPGVRIVGTAQTAEDRLSDQSSILLEGDGLPDDCRLPEGLHPIRLRPIYDEVRVPLFKELR